MMPSHRDHMYEAVIRDGFVLFWGGPFSQWHPSVFEIDGFRYNCAEQYMMAEKARLFGDHERLAKILASDSPKGQKEHGRRVANFQASRWSAECRNVVFRGSLAKFSQDDELKEILMETGTMRIVEASPHDRIWGIGMRKEDPRAVDPKQWLGTNWLGEAIMRARETIRSGPPG